MKASSTFPEVVIELQVTPGASRNEIRHKEDGTYRIAIAAAAEKGKANRTLVKTLAKALSIRKSQITIVSGEHSRRKRLCIAGISASTLEQRLEGAAHR